MLTGLPPRVHARALNHDILCVKLVNLGFSPQIVEWCRNYLTDVASPRDQSWDHVLFSIIYVNDLLEIFINTPLQITLYADDTVLYACHIHCDVTAGILKRA